MIGYRHFQQPVFALFSWIGGAIFCMSSGYILVKAWGSMYDTRHSVKAKMTDIATPSKIILVQFIKYISYLLLKNYNSNPPTTAAPTVHTRDRNTLFLSTCFHVWTYGISSVPLITHSLLWPTHILSMTIPSCQCITSRNSNAWNMPCRNRRCRSTHPQTDRDTYP